MAGVQTIRFKIAALRAKGINLGDFKHKYSLRNLPGKYMALHLLCIMYVVFINFQPPT